MNLLWQFGVIASQGTTALLAPVNAATPALSSTAPSVGDTIACSAGTWENVPTSYAYQWRRNGEPVPGANSSSYLITEEDIGAILSCDVTASNAAGSSDPVSSDATWTIPSPVPVNVTAPSLDDSAPIQGDLITCDTGTWSDSPTAFAYQWQRSEPGFSVWSDIPGATTNNYSPSLDDKWMVLRCRVIASNGYGDSEAAYSNATDMIPSSETRFAVEGVEQFNGDTINLPYETSVVSVLGAWGSSIEGLTGNTGLTTGDNICTFTVRAQDGVATLEVEITLRVLTAAVAERTSIQCVDDVDGSLNGKYFVIFNALGSVAVWLNNGATLKEQTQIAFTSYATSYIVDGPGYYVLLENGAGETHCFWFQVNLRPETTEPELGGSVIYHRVDLLGTDDPYYVSLAAQAAIYAAGWNVSWNGFSSLLIEDMSPGPRIDASGTIPDTISIIQQGDTSYASAPEGFGATVEISFANNASAGALAYAMATALAATGYFTGDYSGAVAIIEDASTGARDDAYDVDTGFTITVTRQGADDA